MVNKIKALMFILVIALGLAMAPAELPGSARAAGGNIYLPKIARLTPPSAGYTPANPGFEAGDTGWIFFYDNGNPIRTNTLAHTGTWSAELGAYYDPTAPEPFAYQRRAYVQQLIYVLPATPVLQFWEYIISDETQCLSFLGDFVSVYVNNVEAARAPICSPVEGQPVPWAIRQVDLSAYAGKWAYLRIEYNSDSTLPSDYYIDDVALVSKP
jgi:hypothetical protein